MSTPLTVPFLLPPDLLVIPVTELSAASREKLDAADGDFAITRPKSRTASSVVDADSADLLQRFRSARTIIEAVVDFSRARSADPHTVLEGSYPVLRRLISAKLLVPAEDTLAQPIVASLGQGDHLDEFQIVQSISLLFDVELYQARAPDGALCLIKLARKDGGNRIIRSLEREASALSRLADLSVPRLLRHANYNSLPYLAVEWCEGVSPTVAASELRDGIVFDRVGLLKLCRGVAIAYAQLHDRRVIHGDVHSMNVLVDRNARVTLIDFGQAYDVDAESHNGVARGGVLAYHDPEMAAAFLAGHSAPLPTMLSEQYAVGALLYRIVAGVAYVELAVRRETALRQILSDGPVPFETHGLAPWPELESVLSRMLAKNPSDRFATMSAVVEALDKIPTEQPVAAPSVGRSTWAADELFNRLMLDGTAFQSRPAIGPHCSVNNGAAGIAAAWYRLALFRDDPKALATAGAWGRRASAWTSTHEALFLDDATITPKTVGRTGLFHSETGIHCVRALVAHAAGDPGNARRSTEAFESSARRRSDKWDFTLGRAGILTGCALMFEADPTAAPGVRTIGKRHALALQKTLTAAGSVRASASIEAFGIAHGWAGALYALMRWASATRDTPAPLVRDRLDELASYGERGGRGMSWPRYRGRMEDGLQPTWCNGDAGFVFLWLLAEKLFSDERFLKLAELAAWNVADRAPDRMTDLCCGSAGRAYSFLALYRRTGDAIWLARAKRFAGHAARAIDPDANDAHRLYKGALGAALLIHEIEDPARARMPLFESEGWHWRHPRVT